MRRLPRHASCKWEDVQEASWPQAVRILRRIRTSGASMAGTHAEEIAWGYAWSERPTLLRADDTSYDRAVARWRNIREAYLCGHARGRTWRSKVAPSTPLLLDVILAEEDAREG